MTTIKTKFNKDGVDFNGTITFTFCPKDSDIKGSKNIVTLKFGVEDAPTQYVTIPEDSVFKFVKAIIESHISNMTFEPDTLHLNSSTLLNFESFSSHSMGRGLVAYTQTEAQRDAGQYDPHSMFVHKYAEHDSKIVQEQVALECRLLAFLLNKFRINNSDITDDVKECAVT